MTRPRAHRRHATAGLALVACAAVLAASGCSWRRKPPTRSSSTTTAATAATTATTTAAALAVVAVAAGLHLGDDLGIVFRGQRLLRDPEQRILATDVCGVRLGEPHRRVEQRFAGPGARAFVELAGSCRDHTLELDLRRVLGRQRGELGGELGPARRQAREHRALLVEEVPGDRALEVRDGAAHALEVALVGAAGGEAPRGLEEPGHDLVVTAVRALELSEAGQVHTRRGSTTGLGGHKRLTSPSNGGTANRP